MQVLETKQKLEEVISALPENKLKAIIDFACYLRDRDEVEELLRMQRSSKAYLDWLSPRNLMSSRITISSFSSTL
jgi:hypothetical protein